MSSAAASLAGEQLRPGERVEVLFGELAELCGQRNAIDSRLVQIVAELDRDGLCGSTGAKSIPELVAWKTGTSLRNAHTITAIAHRLEQFPRCAAGMREGRLSLDQVGVIAERAADGSDEHYAQLAAVATVSQLHTAVKLEPAPTPIRGPNPRAASPGPRVQTMSTRRGGSGYRAWTPRSSTPPWHLIVMRRSPRGNTTTKTAGIRLVMRFRCRRSPTASTHS